LFAPGFDDGHGAGYKKAGIVGKRASAASEELRRYVTAVSNGALTRMTPSLTGGEAKCPSSSHFVARISDAIRARVNEMSARLDPVILLRDIRAMQERLATLADAPPSGSPAAPSIELFLEAAILIVSAHTLYPPQYPPRSVW